MFPSVYFFFPETRLRSLEEMDDIFKKSTSIFDAPWISIREPHRYDKHGNLKPEYLEERPREKNDGTPEHISGEENDSDRAAASAEPKA